MDKCFNELEALEGFAVRVYHVTGLRPYVDTDAIAEELTKRSARIEPLEGYPFTFEQQLSIVEFLMSKES